MKTLYDEAAGQPIGTITDEQFQFLVDQLEEESSQDQDYAISQMLLAYFEEIQADPELVSLLRSALGEREEMEIREIRERRELPRCPIIPACSTPNSNSPL